MKDAEYLPNPLFTIVQEKFLRKRLTLKSRTTTIYRGNFSMKNHPKTAQKIVLFLAVFCPTIGGG
jgi:hypothetical protein